MNKKQLADRYEYIENRKHPVVKQTKTKQVKYSDGNGEVMTMHAWRRWAEDKGYVVEKRGGDNCNNWQILNPFNMKPVRFLDPIGTKR